MPPSIHPVRLISVLRLKALTPAIVFLTSRRSCDEALQGFEHAGETLSASRQETITQVLDELTKVYPSIQDHPLKKTVTTYGVAAHHAGHLPSWKIAVEELMRRGHLDAVFATTTLAAGVDFPARTVILTQSGVKRDQDFTDLSTAEVQQIAGRAGRRGKDSVGFAIVTPSPYMDMGVLVRGLTGRPEPIDSQFVISYPMVLNLLKAHPVDHIQSILAKSFAQYQLNAQAERLELRNEKLHDKLETFHPRECSDWLSQWQAYDQATRQTTQKLHTRRRHPPEVRTRLPFLTPGRLVSFPRFRGIVLRNYRSRAQHREMVTVLREGGTVAESAVADISGVQDRVFDFAPAPTFPWAAPESLAWLSQQLQTLPKQVPVLTMPAPTPDDESAELVKSLGDLFPCPTCRCRPTCAKEFNIANKMKQEWQHNQRSMQSLRTGLWHKFQECADILHELGYLDASYKLTADGEWARYIRIDYSLLITELIRSQAFAEVAPPVLAGMMACIAYENDRPASFPRISPALAGLVSVARRMAERLAAHDDPPLLRADVGGLAERWVGDRTMTWAQLCRSTSTAEGDVFRLLSRTLEYLSQLHSLRTTHPDLSRVAGDAMDHIRRGVLEELP
jgi:ATP-dependent RNA helicase HelY